MSDTLDLKDIHGGKDQLGSQIRSLYDRWKGANYQAREMWAETKQHVYATDTYQTENAKNPWSNSTVRPKLCSLYDNLIVNYRYALFPDDKWLIFEGHDQASSTMKQSSIMQDYMQTKHNLSDFYDQVNELINDWVLCGNCFVYVDYVNEYTSRPSESEPVLSYTGPRISRISPYEIVFDPTARNFESSPKIRRFLKTEGELYNMAMENPSAGYSQEVLDAVRDDRQSLLHYTNDELLDMGLSQVDGFGSYSEYLTSGQVELYEFYGDLYDVDTGIMYKNHVITVADNNWVIRKEPLNTWSGKPPIFHIGWRTRPDNLWAQGPLDNVIGLQYRINHLENARADAFDQMLDPDWVFTGDVDYKQEGASKHFYLDLGGSVNHLAPDTNVLNADFQISNLEQEMELYVGAPREAMGVRSPGEKTAFEVQALTSAASRMFESKTNEFSKFLEKIVNAEMEAAQRNLNTVDVIKSTDSEFGAVEFINITAQDITSNGRLRAVGSRHYATQQKQAMQLQQFMQFMGDPEVKQHFPSIEIAKRLTSYMGEDEDGFMIPYGRIFEQAEAAKLMNVAQRQVQEHDMVPVGQDDEVM